MFTVQTVHNNDEEGNPINVQFANETSHDLENHSDLVQDEGHTLEHIEGQCPQSLSQTDVTSVQGSYVSLLADIATIEQNDDYSGQQIAQDISDTVDYAASTFTGQEHIQEIASLQNENLVSYQSVDNHNIGYSFTNPVESGQEIPQYVIIQPFLGDTSVNGTSTLIHLPNTAESLDSNRELEDAVANITEKAVADTDETLDGKVMPDQSYLQVSTNSRGEVREIQVVEGEQSWTANDAEVSTSKRKGRFKGLDKGMKGKQKKSVITEKKESSLHVKKFSLDDLNSFGKSKKEVFEEFVGKNKVKNDTQNDTIADTFSNDIEKSTFDVECYKSDVNLQGLNTVTKNSTEILNAGGDKTFNLHSNKVVPLNDTQSPADFEKVNETCQSDSRDESLESNMMGNFQGSAKASEFVSEDKIESKKDTVELCLDAAKINKDSVEDKRNSRLTKHQTLKSKTRILRSRQVQDMTSSVKLRGYDSENLEKDLSKEKDHVRLKINNTSLKRKKPMHDLRQSHKFSKIDDFCEENEKNEDQPRDDNTDYRVLEDFCRIFRSEEKCILHLKPITLKLVNPNQLFMIEMNVQSDFNVSSLETGVTEDGLTKYYVKFTVPEKVTLDNETYTTNHANKKQKVERIKNKSQKQALQCLKRSGRKQKKVIIEKNLVKDTEKALRSKEENNKEIEGKNCNESEMLDSEINANVVSNQNNNASRDTQQIENDHDEDIEMETHNDADELETNEDTDISNNQNKNECSTKSKRKKDGKLSGKKKPKVDKSSNYTKEELSQKSYTVVVSEEGKKMYQCELCGKEMSIRQNMDVHINQHTGERPWQCEVCGLGFRGPSNLRAHMNQHDEEMRFQCAICFKKFRDRGTYRQHYKRHLGEKKHVCEHCGKSFVISSDLKKHIRTHTGEKPYRCSLCDQQFSDGSSLVRHEKMHAAKFRYECNACRRQYSRKDLCKKHINKAHTDKVEVEINEISIIEDINQVTRDVNTGSKGNEVKNLQKTMRTNSKRESVPNTRVKKLKKSWQNLTEEASKRYKEQTTQNLPGTNQYREYTHPVLPTYNIIDYQSMPTFYGNINQKFPDQQKPPQPSDSDQGIIIPQGPLVFQSYIRSLTDSDM